MKLNEVIVDGTEFEAFSDAVKNDCSDFVNAFNVNADHFSPLFRGESGKTFSVKSVNMNREPVDSSDLSTLVFNNIIEQAYGISRLRNTSVFCTHKAAIAEGYAQRDGQVRLVFFPNGATYFVADGHHDSIRLLSEIDIEAKMLAKSPRWAAKFSYKTNGLLDIAPSLSEIYLAVTTEPWGGGFIKELMVRTKQAIHGSMKISGVKTVLHTDDESEITVTGIDHYYSIELDYVLNFFNTASIDAGFRRYISYLQGKGPLFTP